jgi:purine-binding chemotaxis protein CheW
MINTYLSFVVCDELFAVNVVNVLEVLQKQRITKVPNAPTFIKGIINFRGEIVPVFESRVKFSLPDREENHSYVVIVLDFTSGSDVFRIGAIVDKVKDVINIDDTEIKSVPKMTEKFKTDFLKGIFKLKEDFILLLDVEKVFTGEEQIAIKEANKLEESSIS